MSVEEPSYEEVPEEEEESESESPLPVPGPRVPPPTIPILLEAVRSWTVEELLRLITALTHEAQTRFHEVERARASEALAVQLGAPWRRDRAAGKGKGKGGGKVNGERSPVRPSSRQEPY